MAEVAKKIRFYFIWEQDDTYQNYIRPHWGKFGIPTIISDQFIAIFYHWKKYMPADKQAYLVGSWMKAHILENHGPLCSLYKAHGEGRQGIRRRRFPIRGRFAGVPPHHPERAAQHGIARLGRLGRAFCQGPRKHLARSGAGARLPISRGSLVYELGLGTPAIEEGNPQRCGLDRLSQASVALDRRVAKRLRGAGRLVREAL